MRTITCPHCGFSRDLPAKAIPEGATAANCPSCGKRFALQDGTTSPERPIDQQADEVGQPNGSPVSSRQDGSVRDTEDRIVCPVCSTAQEPSENCVHCGLIFSKWEEVREEGEGFYLAESGELLDESLKRKEHRPRDVQPRAGFWQRLTAAMVDLVVLVAAQFLFGVLLNAVVMLISWGWLFGPAGWNILILPIELFNIVLFLSYFIVFTGYGGQTPGKMLLGIKVIRTDGTEVGYARAFLREAPGKLISTLPFGLGFFLIGIQPEKRGLHDLLAGTSVIKLE